LRGDIIPVIEVRKRFGKPTREYDNHTCIVVVENTVFTIGLIVDSVKEVMYIDAANVLPPPSAKLNHHNQFVRNIGRVGDGVKLLLDLEKFLNQG
jgi:purine-binding chemotaxis protein CheW